MRTLLDSFDAAITRLVTTKPPASAKRFFVIVTTIGHPIVIIAIAAVVMAVGLGQNTRLFWAGLLILIVLFIGALMKVGVERMRPVSDYVIKMKFDTYSFPSGHSSGATIAYGLLAYVAYMRLPSPLNYVTTTVLISVLLLVGISRVYLKAHYPSDVVGGWILGFSALAIIVFVVRPFV